jgi:hypothetical protein
LSFGALGTLASPDSISVPCPRTSPCNVLHRAASQASLTSLQQEVSAQLSTADQRLAESLAAAEQKVADSLANMEAKVGAALVCCCASSVLQCQELMKASRPL